MTYISKARLKKKALSYVCQRPTQIWKGEPLVHHEVAKTPDLDKNVKVKTAGEVVEFKENRLLLARLMMVCKSRPEVSIKESVAVHPYLGKAVKERVKY